MISAPSPTREANGFIGLVMDDGAPIAAPGIRSDARWRIGAAAVCSFSVLIELCNATALEPWFGCSLSVLLLALVTGAKRVPRLQPLDVCMALLSIVAMQSATCSVDSAAGEAPALRVGIMVMLYAFVRIAGPAIKTALFWVLSATAALLSLGYGVVTALRYLRLTQAGLGNLVAFRDQFAALQGETPAAWITVSLALLPYPLVLLMTGKTRAARWTSAAIATVVLVCIGLTFSRGVYIGAAVFLAGSLVGALGCGYAPRIVLRRILAPIFLGSLLLLPVSPSVVNTVLMVQTRSQTRSLAGRVVVWRQAQSVLRSHPFRGSGIGTFAVEYGRYKDPSAPMVYSAFNIGFETLVEQGPVALLLWAAVFALFGMRAVGIWRDRGLPPEERFAACVMAASAISLLVRDASYASLSTGPVLVLLVLMLGAGANAGAHATR